MGNSIHPTVVGAFVDQYNQQHRIPIYKPGELFSLIIVVVSMSLVQILSQVHDTMSIQQYHNRQGQWLSSRGKPHTHTRLTILSLYLNKNKSIHICREKMNAVEETMCPMWSSG
ncbi:hypothetical protein AVEN_252214-1 [Araneus ventricosus]|uniref:Uncharacterized protein n=1 Tax=Araneus ventricosus TaxID=182803 RepID=A0A4Y2UQ90_ARAVE|nr:hypothetical protein AVEN_252214-1 [Araneus ventricosus]